MRRASLLVVALATSLAVVGEIRAQDVEIEITDRGAPLSGVEIAQFANGIKSPQGVTDRDGGASFPPDALEFSDGERVSVWVRRCEDGRVEVILVAEGEDDPCVEDDAARGEGCGCERIGGFVWGDGRVRIDVGEGTVRQAPEGAGGGLWTSSLTFGLGIDGRQMLQLEDVVGLADGATDADATSFAPGVQLFVEYLLWDVVGIGLEGGWSRMDTQARFGDQVQTGEMDYFELGITTRIGPRLGDRFRPYAAFGLFRAWNDAEFELGGATEERDHVTRRDGLGLGFDYWPGKRWGVRAEGLYNSTFKDDDADEHIRWKLGLMYRPFGDDMDEVIQ